MKNTFVFYDLETSGTSPKQDRIMQFASQRTDMDLNKIGDPVNLLVKLTPEVLPSPYAILVNRISPQQTLDEGYSEPEFLKIFHQQVSLPGTIFVGYNNIRFDDEFMRYTNYRNFYDAYEWHYKNGRSRWDLLDVARMMRALRWDGMNWPVDSKGQPSNRLELLTSANAISHKDAHDALADVEALIEIARLMKKSQAKLFDFLLLNRSKEKVLSIVGGGKPFVYSSGRYASEHEKTTVVSLISLPGVFQGDIVFDLRHDPEEFLALSDSEIAGGLSYRRKNSEEKKDLPVKLFKANKCPAIAPLGVIDKKAAEKIKIDLNVIEQNRQKLEKSRQDIEVLLKKALKMLESENQKQSTMLISEFDVDEMLYDGFIGGADKSKMDKVTSLDKSTIAEFEIAFKDDRLNNLYPIYKARNYPDKLSPDEYLAWEKFRQYKLLNQKNAQSPLEKYFKQIEEIKSSTELSESNKFILEDLILYGQSIAP
jgi:exodeoxyribonuclease I